MSRSQLGEDDTQGGHYTGAQHQAVTLDNSQSVSQSVRCLTEGVVCCLPLLLQAEDEGRLGDEADPGEESEAGHHSEHSTLLLQEEDGENHDEDGGGEEDGGGVTQGQLGETEEDEENPKASCGCQQDQIHSDLPVCRTEKRKLLVVSNCSCSNSL